MNVRISENLFHFPYDVFASAADFDAFIGRSRPVLDQRFAYERGLAQSAPGPVLLSAGSCAVCLRATHFTTPMPSAGSALPAAGHPNWREGQICACPHALNARFRALLQFMVAELEPRPWTRLLLLGAAQSIEPRLAPLVASVDVQARSGRRGQSSPLPAAHYHVILSSELLHAAPVLDDALAELHAALVPGGHLVFTAPFDSAAAKSRPPRGGRTGILGWDVLDRLAAAGFGGASAYMFWSEEFGYLGPFNLIFVAAA